MVRQRIEINNVQCRKVWKLGSLAAIIHLFNIFDIRRHNYRACRLPDIQFPLLYLFDNDFVSPRFSQLLKKKKRISARDVDIIVLFQLIPNFLLARLRQLQFIYRQP